MDEGCFDRVGHIERVGYGEMKGAIFDRVELPETVFTKAFRPFDKTGTKLSPSCAARSNFLQETVGNPYAFRDITSNVRSA